MNASILILSALLLSGGPAVAGPALQQQEDARAEAESWMARADSVRGVVEAVLASAVEAGAEEHAVAKDNVADARHWVDEAETAMKRAEEAYGAEDYSRASTFGNLAWQYYVKAGTAAVLAARLAGDPGG